MDQVLPMKKGNLLLSNNVSLRLSTCKGMHSMGHSLKLGATGLASILCSDQNCWA